VWLKWRPFTAVFIWINSHTSTEAQRGKDRRTAMQPFSRSFPLFLSLCLCASVANHLHTSENRYKSEDFSEGIWIMPTIIHNSQVCARTY
jgi:hypothetical protein